MESEQGAAQAAEAPQTPSVGESVALHPGARAEVAPPEAATVVAVRASGYVDLEVVDDAGQVREVHAIPWVACLDDAPRLGPFILWPAEA